MQKTEKSGAAPSRGYHHGDLRHALIETAETLLAERGVEGFSLRECARRAGVSPAAPAHHFGNMPGLLTAIATLGFEGLADAMEAEAAASDGTPEARLEALARGYIHFALGHPDRFRVVFGRFPLDRTDQALQAAGARAYALLASAVTALPRHSFDTTAAIVVAWSAVHGFVTLVLDGHTPFIDPGEDKRTAVERLSRQLGKLLMRALAA